MSNPPTPGPYIPESEVTRVFLGGCLYISGGIDKISELLTGKTFLRTWLIIIVISENSRSERACWRQGDEEIEEVLLNVHIQYNRSLSSSTITTQTMPVSKDVIT